jgi:hypothetical protein
MHPKNGLTFGFVTVVLIGVVYTYYRINLQLHCESQLKEEAFSFPTRQVASKNEETNETVTIAKALEDTHDMLTPFFIGAGLGTSGTTTLFQAMCNLGFPSVHYKRYCIRVDLNHTIEKSLNVGVEAHFRVLQTFDRLKNCSKNSRINGANTCPDYNAVHLRLLKEVATVVKSGLMFVIDTPYSFLVPYLRKIAKTEGLRDIVILTERDPKKWAISRILQHRKEADVMCQRVESAFDLQTCLQNEKDPAKLLFQHTELKKVVEEYDNFLVNSMKVFQRTTKNQHPTINFNLWNEELLDITHIHSALLSRMEYWVSPSTLAYHANAATALVEERRQWF